MHTILIIDGEEKAAEYLKQELTREGYIVEVATNGRAGLERALQEKWDIILLEIILSELNGMEVLRRVKKAAPVMPVIIVTTRNETSDIISGLDNGANDYVTKPYNTDELFARIRASLRNRMLIELMIDSTMNLTDDRLIVAGLSLNRKTREVVRDCRPIELTMKEFDLLVYLIENKPNVVSREQIIQQVWGYDFVGDTNIVDVYIRYLRKKVDYSFKTSLIQTIRGVGYSIQEETSSS
ncbi:DNA-binding response regulator [Paenibacillus psychroresistens]|uniref:DNA-binding response regulator n=1 Tax=Paenibacillus psychroresistens TaxID=1778678 RepID=A0A6B8RFU2_9BACL|nr:response regulator transcription factor [Paenibacillus psychroresistens]QGQ95331.1 DNA-binding response regulator [Paenibacillus psychroresistens]